MTISGGLYDLIFHEIHIILTFSSCCFSIIFQVAVTGFDETSENTEIDLLQSVAFWFKSADSWEQKKQNMI